MRNERGAITVSSVYAALLVRLRYPVVAGWIGFAVYVTFALPSIQQAATGPLGALVPHGAEAVKAEVASAKLFGFPVLTRTIDVQRRASGFGRAAELRAVRRAVAVDQGRYPDLRGLEGAYPLANTAALPFARGHGTTILTYLFFSPSAGTGTRVHESAAFARKLDGARDGFVGVTGTFPARATYQDTIDSHLDLVTLATLLLVLVLVGYRFRAVGAPLITIAAVGVSYFTAVRVVAYLAQRAGLTVPSEVQPIIIVLLFGVVTDYAVFALARVRERREGGELRVEAARRATEELLPILIAAGLTVVLASAALVVSPLDFFRAFGPGMAIAVLVALLVSISFVPAALAIFGNAVYWPRPPAFHAPEGRMPGAEEPDDRRPLAIRVSTRFPVPVALVGLALLGLGISGLARLDLGGTLIRGLPGGSPPYRAYQAATKAFAPGAIAPTVVVLEGGDLRRHRPELAHLQRALAAQPGVAGVLGPASTPLAGRVGAALSKTHDAARYLVILDSAPYGAAAISALRGMEARLPALLRRAGLGGGTRTLVAGDTALQAETVAATTDSVYRIVPAALAVIFLILVVLLRALVAPVYLIVAAALGPAAAIGVSAYFFQDLLGFGQVTYYVPVATMVLLIALGSDYNVYLVGRVWEEARRRSMRDAVLVGGGGATKAISTAGLALAGSFALLALIPLLAFRQIAFTMAAGLLIDAFVVRAFLIPALIVLLGRRNGWPGSALRREPPERRIGLGRERVATSVTGRRA